MSPLAPFGDGRDNAGRFANGNPGGPGNPEGRRVAAFRRAFLKAVTPADVAAVVQVLIDRAKAGEAWAVREMLDRSLGRATSAPDAPPIPVEHRHFIVPPPRLLGERDAT